MSDIFSGFFSGTDGLIIFCLIAFVLIALCLYIGFGLGGYTAVASRYAKEDKNYKDRQNRDEDRYLESRAYRQNYLHNEYASAQRRINNKNARSKLFEGTNEIKQRRAEKKEIAAARNAAELEEAIGLAGRRRKGGSRKQKKN
jgi:hypothetical protein